MGQCDSWLVSLSLFLFCKARMAPISRAGMRSVWENIHEMPAQGVALRRCSVNISPFPLPLPFRMGHKRSKNVGELSDALSGECSMGCCGWNRVRVRRGSAAFEEKSVSKGFYVIGCPFQKRRSPGPKGSLADSLLLCFPLSFVLSVIQNTQSVSNWSWKDTDGDSSLLP